MDSKSQSEILDMSSSVVRQKIVIVGDVAVGKTAMIVRVIENKFKQNYEPSIGVDFSSKTIKFRGKTLKLQIWDSAGQEKYRSLIPSYVKGSSLVFLVYDVTKAESFKNLTSWINFIKNIENPIIVILGNKIDIPENEKQVSTKEGENFARKHGLLFFEVSAKEDINIHYAFNQAITELPFFTDYNITKEEVLIELGIYHLSRE